MYSAEATISAGVRAGSRGRFWMSIAPNRRPRSRAIRAATLPGPPNRFALQIPDDLPGALAAGIDALGHEVVRDERDSDAIVLLLGIGQDLLDGHRRAAQSAPRMDRGD